MAEKSTTLKMEQDEDMATQEIHVTSPRARVVGMRVDSGHASDDYYQQPIQTTFFDGSYTSAASSTPSAAASASRLGSGATGTARNASATTRTARAMPTIPAWQLYYNLALVLLDAMMMLLSCSIIYAVRPDIIMTVTEQLPGGFLITTITFCAVWIVSLAIIKSYHRHTMGEGYSLYAKILTAALIDFIAVCSIGFLFNVPYPRTLVVLAPVIAAVITTIERWIMRRVLHANRRRGEFNFPTVLVGSPQGIHETIDKLTTTMGLSAGYAPIAVCPIAAVSNDSDPDAPQHLIAVPFEPRNDQEARLRVLALNSHLAQTAKHLGAQSVLITDVLTRDSETMRTLSLAVESANMELAITASVADIGGGRLVLRNDSALPILSASLPQYSWPTRLCKRTMDILGSLVALIPGMIIIGLVAIAIKLEDGGPVFYKQERIGIYGKPFYCLKIRSMRVDADKMDAEVAKAAGVELGATFKVKNDPRITRVGKFIRKTSIDEIPQFINVIRGDMSLVGPRPQRQYEVDQYSPLYSTRLLVRPGITGPWQIGGRNDLSQEDAEFLDVNYVENWSLMTDIAILIKTVGVVLRGDGAY
ncbi:sugar transferase [Bifidobacterium sp. SO1]|uniref:sugar transferase n=1 Tax=Bifidobacterium sp. SO1 TaxID=2809029 RepID=UPI001F0AA7FD|nr:sugar transferase [Bifidobacterium sp. SO1]